MNERLYRSLVATVNQYAFWIKVRDADAFQEGPGLSGDGGTTVPVRCLKLYAAYQYGKFPAGYEWCIPLSDIHKAVRKIGAADQEFRIRMNRYEVTRYDAERIIELASYGIIQLHLI